MVTATLDGTGLLLDLPNLSVLDPKFTEICRCTKVALSDDVLARLPLRTFAYDVPPGFVYSVVGVRPR